MPELLLVVLLFGVPAAMTGAILLRFSGEKIEHKTGLPLFERVRVWNPIGIRDVPEAQDEYDSYVGGVYRLLADGAAAVEVAKHLARIEGEQMGLPSSADVRLSVATKLCGLNVKISNGAV